MKTKNKKAENIILVAIGLLLAVSVILGFAFQDKVKMFATDIATDTKNRDKPKFTFQSDDFPDWATTGNTYMDIDPISAINVSQCSEGNNCSHLVEECRAHIDKSNHSCQKLDQYTAQGCEVRAYYSSGSINPDAAIKNQLEEWSSHGDSFRLSPIAVGIKTLTMSTPEGNIKYQLHQYDSDKDNTYKKGTAFGFISLSNGHIEVQSTCLKASQLDDVLPALSALSLEK